MQHGVEREGFEPGIVQGAGWTQYTCFASFCSRFTLASLNTRAQIALNACYHKAPTKLSFQGKNPLPSQADEKSEGLLKKTLNPKPKPRPVFAEGEDLTVLLLPCSGYTYWGLVENKGAYYISIVGHKGYILYSFIPCYLIGLGRARVYIYRASITVGLK